MSSTARENSAAARSGTTAGGGRAAPAAPPDGSAVASSESGLGPGACGAGAGTDAPPPESGTLGALPHAASKAAARPSATMSVGNRDHILHQLRLAVPSGLQLRERLETALYPLVVDAVAGERGV